MVTCISFDIISQLKRELFQVYISVDTTRKDKQLNRDLKCIKTPDDFFFIVIAKSK